MKRFVKKYERGFSIRLNHVLDLINLPQPGRYSYIARVTGMGHSNSRTIFLNDRPPKKTIFMQKLTTHLSYEVNRIHRFEASPDMFRVFLLFGESEVASWLTQKNRALINTNCTQGISSACKEKVEKVIMDHGFESSMFVESQWYNLIEVVSRHIDNNSSWTETIEVNSTIINAASILAKNRLL